MNVNATFSFNVFYFYLSNFLAKFWLLCHQIKRSVFEDLQYIIPVVFSIFTGLCCNQISCKKGQAYLDGASEGSDEGAQA